ncbi:MAG: radical SAM protein, partial [Bacteroidales bacterium]
IKGQLKAFGGDFILQTMFLRGMAEDPVTGERKPIDCTKPELVASWQDLVREIRPREVMMYTIDRPTPDKELQKVSVEEMQAIAAPLVGEGFKVQIRG